VTPDRDGHSTVILLCALGDDDVITVRAICEDTDVTDRVNALSLDDLKHLLTNWPRYNRGRHLAMFTKQLQDAVRKGRIK